MHNRRRRHELLVVLLRCRSLGSKDRREKKCTSQCDSWILESEDERRRRTQKERKSVASVTRREEMREREKKKEKERAGERERKREIARERET